MNDKQLIQILYEHINNNKGAKEAQKDIKDTQNTADKASKSLSNMFKGVGVVAFTKLVSDATAKIVELTKKSSDYIETLNLLDAAFDNNTEGIKKFANSFAETLNLDDKTLLEAAAHFKVLSQSMGIATQTGEEFSKLLTQMTLDVSSLYNIDFNKAQTALQYAVEGRGTSLKQRTGVSVLETSVQTTLDTLGVDAYVEDMNDAEKAIARLISMEYQLRTSQGDLARTIEAPANQFRVLGEQISMVGRNIGNILLPMLANILPYVNAVLIVINKLLSSLAKLVGYDPAAFDYFTDTDAIDYFEDLGGAVGGVGKAADTTRKKLLGLRSFDQLNVIKSPTETPRGGGGGGGSGAGGINPKLLEAFDKMFAGYDSMLDGVKTKASQIAEKILDWLGYTDGTYTNLKKIKTLLSGGLGLAIGTGITTKIAEAITGEKGLTAIFGSSGIAGKIGLSGGQLGGIFAKAFFDTTNWFYQWDKVSSKLKQGEGAKSFGTGFMDALKSGDVGGQFKAIADGASEALAYYNSMTHPILEVAGAVRFANSAIQGTGEQTIVLSKETAEKLKKIEGDWLNASQTIKALQFTPQMKIDDKFIEDTKTNVRKLVEGIINELEDGRNKEIQFIEEMQRAGGGLWFDDEEKKKIINKINKHYDERKIAIENAEKRINEITEKYRDKNIQMSKEDKDELIQLYTTLSDETVSILSTNAEEQELIRTKLVQDSSNMSKEMASNLIKNAYKTRDETIAAANKQYDEQIKQANRMKEAKTITENEYQMMIDAAKTTRDATIEEANAQADETYRIFKENNEALSKEIDESTGEIKSKWTMFWEDIGNHFKEKWDGIKKFYNDHIAKFFTKEYWSDVFNKMVNIPAEKLAEMWQGVKNWWNNNVAKYFTKDYWQNKLDKTFSNLTAKIKTPHITWTSGKKATGWIKDTLEALHLPTSLPKLNVEWYAQGGMPDMGQLFIANERGPELVGQIGGQSFVANQNQMMDLLDKKIGNAGGMKSATFVIQVGDEVIAQKVLDDLNGMAKNDGKPIVIRGV